MKYVLIGNSAASLAAIEGIRRVDKRGEILLLGEEAHTAYGRPLISYLLEGKTDEQKLPYKDEWFLMRNGVTERMGVRVTAIDRANKCVALSDGSVQAYDKLLIATGSTPFVPPVQGLEGKENVFTFMKLSDALALGERLDEKSRVVIVGGGLIGLKAAEGIFAHTKNITVVELAPRILSTVLDEEGSQIVREHLQAQGVCFKLGTSVVKAQGERAVSGVELANGEHLDCDVLVMAVGVRPNTALAKEAGLSVNRGVLVDLMQRTGDPDVYAAGDVCEGYDAVSNTQRILALWVNAARQGEVAGEHMAGGTPERDCTMALNAIGLFGLDVATAGVNQAEGYQVCTRREGREYRRLVFLEDALVGYVLIGKHVDGAGILTGLIAAGTKRGQWGGDPLTDALTPRLLPPDVLLARLSV